MDAAISPLSGTIQQYAPAPAKIASGSAVPAAATGLVFPVHAPAVTAGSGNVADKEYENTVRQAALSFKNVYALSDHQFTIFKDASGKYITRYVSLRDGKVTYIPDPTLIKQMQIEQGNTGPVRVAINV